MAVDDGTGILYRIAGPAAAEGKFIIRSLHVVAWPGTVMDDVGAEIPVVNLYVLDREPGEPGPGKDPRVVMEHPDAVRYMITVGDMPLFLEYLETHAEKSLAVADPGRPAGSA